MTLDFIMGLKITQSVI